VKGPFTATVEIGGPFKVDVTPMKLDKSKARKQALAPAGTEECSDDASPAIAGRATAE